MNEFEDIDRELEAAFTQRPSTLSRPSLRDVKQRARRHQRQRSAGVLGACAIVGVGGAAVLATRSPANQVTVGDDSDQTASTICFPTATTMAVNDASTFPFNTLPVTTYTYSGMTYVLQSGDNPTSIAQQFGVSLDALNAANAGTPDYDIFYVGLEIKIPDATIGSTNTTSPLGIAAEYKLQSGDFPASVADMFQVSVAEMDAVNQDTLGYDAWLVGTKINIPFGSQVAVTTTEPSATGVPQTTIFPEPTEWTTTTGFTSSADFTCVPSATSTVPGDTTNTTTVHADIFEPTKVGTLVQVVNCSAQEGVARLMSAQLAEEGFTTAEPDTCTILDPPVTRILYNPDDPTALEVAKTVAIYLAGAVVEPSGSVVPTLTTGTWAPGSGVIVLLSNDLAGRTLAQIAASATTGTTTTNPQEVAATSTTCIIPPQMTLPPPATTTTTTTATTTTTPGIC